MLGWNVRVYRQAGGGAAAATNESERGENVAEWQAGLDGLGWLDELVGKGAGEVLGGDGYPLRYTVQAKHVAALVGAGIPDEMKTWVCGPDDIIGKGWAGRTVVSPSIGQQPEEWLLIEAWDES